MHATVCLLPRFVYVTKRGRNVSPCVSRGLLILRFRKHSVDDRALRSTLSHGSGEPLDPCLFSFIQPYHHAVLQWQQQQRQPQRLTQPWRQHFKTRAKQWLGKASQSSTRNSPSAIGLAGCKPSWTSLPQNRCSRLLVQGRAGIYRRTDCSNRTHSSTACKR